MERPVNLGVPYLAASLVIRRAEGFLHLDNFRQLLPATHSHIKIAAKFMKPIVLDDSRRKRPQNDSNHLQL